MAIMWNGKVKRRVFELLPNISVNGKKVGFYTREWTSKPPHMTVKEFQKACSLLMEKLIKAGLFPKKPKSSESLNILIQHGIAPQNNPAFRKMRASVRFAAYYAGFMEMSDIVHLEEKAHEKHGSRI